MMTFIRLLIAASLILPALARAEESLSELLARVLPRDPQVRVQQSLLQAAEQRVVQARSRFLPELALELNRGQASSTSLGFPIDRKTDRAQASLGVNVYNGGRDRAEFEAANLEVEAALQDVRRAREDASERIANAYLDVLRASELLVPAEERLRIARAMRSRFAIQHEAGKVSEADRIEAGSIATDAEIEIEDLRAAVAQARGRLLRLIGEPQIALSGWPDGRLRALRLDTSPDEVLSGQTVAARLRADAAQARVPPVWSAAAPRLDVRYDQALRDRTTPALTDQLNQGWTLAVRWSFPLGGESVARVSEGQRRADAALAEAERVQQGAMAEIAGLPERIAAGERSLPLLNERLGQFDKLLPAAELQYEAGRRSLSQLAQIYESRFAVQRRVVEQRHQLRNVHLRLLTLRGELLPALGLSTR